MKSERAVGKSEKLEKREVGKTRSWKVHNEIGKNKVGKF